ncbi:hypothetical protein SBY92_001714 [Candida maltosa Xu316]
MATQYLEPMGNSLIRTFRKSLGNNFNSVLELMWIKVYVFIANSILQYEEEAAMRGGSETSSLNEEEYIPPLNLARRGSSVETNPSPPPPTTTSLVEEKIEKPVIGFDNSKPVKVLDKFNSIEIDLKSNDKYKGFRRSVDVAASPIQVPIPTSSTFKKQPHTMLSNTEQQDADDDYFRSPLRPSFDPRKSKRASNCSSPVPNSPRLNSNNNSMPVFVDKAGSESPRIPVSEGEEDEFVTPRASRRGSFSESSVPPSVVSNKTAAAAPAVVDGASAGSLLAKLKKFQDPESRTLPMGIDEEDDEQDPFTNKSEDSIDAPTFDPRMRRKRTGGIPSPESSEVDEQEEEDMFMNNLKSPSPPFQQQQQQAPATKEKQSVPERSLSRGGLTGGTFDYQSFGLKGLAPIVEDDDASSKYASDDEHHKLSTKSSNTSDEMSNSRTSSLSLNNSDYKSSISSGTTNHHMTDFAPIKGAGVIRPSHLRNMSIETDESFQFANTHNGHKRNTSIYSLGTKSMSGLSVNSTGRASLGFMRSSFVLKKEMETQGFNHPENVTMSLPPTPNLSNKSSKDSLRPPQSIYANKANSVSSFSRAGTQVAGTPYDSAYDLINCFDTQAPPPLPTKDGISTRSSRKVRSAVEPPQQQEKKKGGLRSRLSSIFSSKSNKSQTSLSRTPTNNSSSRISSAVSTNSSSKTAVPSVDYNKIKHNPYGEQYQQQSAPLFASKPPSLMIPPVIKKVESSGCSTSNASASIRKTTSATNKYGHRYAGSSYDLASVVTGETSTSGFSMFRGGNPNGKGKKDVKFVPPLTRNTRKGNKYNVKKVPYDIWA